MACLGAFQSSLCVLYYGTVNIALEMKTLEILYSVGVLQSYLLKKTEKFISVWQVCLLISWAFFYYKASANKIQF